MARKKQEIALQTVIETQEEWEEMLAKEGLHVVDVYQEWSGPCTSMVQRFRKLKLEIGDKLLNYSVAKADTIDSLEKYRGKCQPCFLFYAGGSLVEVIRGANSPQLIKSITEQLAQEHKVLDGSAERKEIRDPGLADDDREKSALDEDENEKDEDAANLKFKGEHIYFDELPQAADQAKKEITVAIIKPDVVSAGRVEEIMQEMGAAGIEILEHQERQLTEDQAREFYGHKKDEEYFEELVKFMSSGPSHVLVLSKGETGENIIQTWKELLGPPNVEEAKEAEPESWRAKYGTEKYANALHGSDSSDTAMRELAFFFPNYSVPSVPTATKRPKIQRTLALIRPDTLKDKKDEILQKVEEAGFQVAMQKEMQLTKEQAEEFYKEHKGQAYFEELTERMSSGPVLALALARDDAITNWRDMLGPTEVNVAKEEAPHSLRAQYSVEGVNINQLHGSDSEETAAKELEYFFPMQQTVAVIKPDAHQTKDEIMDRIREAGFHIAARKETQITKDIAEQFYDDQKEKEYFGDLIEHMTSGPTLFMVLSREDAVDGWRSLIGPTDPEKAKEAAPESLRAKFGHDLKANAVHGSSDPTHAHKNINIIFGELEFDKDGTVKGAEPEETTAGGEEAAATQAEESTEQTQAEDKGEEAAPAATQEESTEQTQADTEQTQQQEDDKQPESTEQEAGTTEQQVAESEEAPKPDSDAQTGGDKDKEDKKEEDKPAESAESKEEAAEQKADDDEKKPSDDAGKGDAAAADKRDDDDANRDAASPATAAEEKSQEPSTEQKPATPAEEPKAEQQAEEETKPAGEEDKKDEAEAEQKVETPAQEEAKPDAEKPAEEGQAQKTEEGSKPPEGSEEKKEDDKKEEEKKEEKKD